MRVEYGIDKTRDGTATQVTVKSGNSSPSSPLPISRALLA